MMTMIPEDHMISCFFLLFRLCFYKQLIKTDPTDKNKTDDQIDLDVNVVRYQIEPEKKRPEASHLSVNHVVAKFYSL